MICVHGRYRSLKRWAHLKAKQNSSPPYQKKKSCQHSLSLQHVVNEFLVSYSRWSHVMWPSPPCRDAMTPPWGDRDVATRGDLSMKAIRCWITTLKRRVRLTSNPTPVLPSLPSVRPFIHLCLLFLCAAVKTPPACLSPVATISTRDIPIFREWEQ